MPHKGTDTSGPFGRPPRMISNSLADYWYLHIPSLVLVAMIYLLILRGVAALAFGWDSTNPVARLLAALTMPPMALAAGLTPRSVPRAGIWLFAIMWTFALLGVLVYVLAALGRRPLWM